MKKYEYAILEWLWDSNSIRIDLPHAAPYKTQGAHPEIVRELTRLGHQGWEVETTAAQGNWLFWTLKRDASGQVAGQQPPKNTSGW